MQNIDKTYQKLQHQAAILLQENNTSYFWSLHNQSEVKTNFRPNSNYSL